MIVLFKQRKFSDYFSDTIAFFKTTGKHYFKNYLIINGGFLMILVVLIYFISKTYMEALFSGINNANQNPNYFFEYLMSNVTLYISVLVVFFLLAIFLTILNLTYPIIYLQLIEKTNGTDFTKTEIISGIKENFGRLIIFFFGMLFVIFPLAIILFGLLFLSVFILIGIPALIIVIPAFLSWIALSYYEFINRKIGFFAAFGSGFRMLQQQFWTIVGTTLLTEFIVQIIQGFLTMIPYIIGLVLLFTSTDNFQDVGNPNDYFSAMTIFMVVIMIFTTICSYIFNNILIVNQGFIYYSLREQNENNTTKNQIDAIGTDFE